MRSMTGYGQAAWQGQGRRIAVEIRAVNQRFLDVRLNLPREYQAWEAELRQQVMAAAERGKIDVNVNRVGTAAGDIAVEVNEALARASLKGWRQLQKQLGLDGDIGIGFLLNRPEFVRVVETRPDASIDLPRVRGLLKHALQAFNRARDREGAALSKDMGARLKHLRQIAAALRRRSALLVPELSRRLAERITAVLGERPLDENRVLQEAAFLAERADVTEELVRLDAHLQRLGELIRERGTVGKAIDFVLQEVHREINTVASKSADLEVTTLTLEARGEVEKLREQVQNVE